MVRRRSSSSSFENRIALIVLSMFATMASIYVASRLWQDSQNRVSLNNQLHFRTGQGKSSISVDDTVKVTTCREQQNKLAALHVDLEKATQEGYMANHLLEHNETRTTNKKLLIVIGILTTFGHKKKRDAIRKAWMPTGESLKELEKERGIVIRFVIGRSGKNGGNSDSEIDSENRQSNDFMILNDHIESPEERSKKTKLFLSQAVKQWDADFYVKANDDVYVNIDTLGAVLTSHLDFPRAYIGCMKSGEVFSEEKQKWYEPDWWKFGEGKSYFQHASGEIFAVSQALAQFVSINRLALRTYASDDVSVGSWFIGLDVKHVDEGKFCCSSWSSGAVCSSAVK